MAGYQPTWAVAGGSNSTLLSRHSISMPIASAVKRVEHVEYPRSEELRRQDLVGKLVEDFDPVDGFLGMGTF